MLGIKSLFPIHLIRLEDQTKENPLNSCLATMMTTSYNSDRKLILDSISLYVCFLLQYTLDKPDLFLILEDYFFILIIL